MDALDERYERERVLFRWSVDHGLIPLGRAERPSELVLTEVAVYLRTADRSRNFSVALIDVMDVKATGCAVSLRQRTGHLIDYAGYAVNWDGRHGPVFCADDAEAMLLADHIRASVRHARLAGPASSPRLRRWNKASR